MSPWELKVGQVLGYRPRGEKWRARVTAIEQDGKCFMGEIPVRDEWGNEISYDEPPASVSPIFDYENYYIVEDVKENTTDPWIAAKLDHQDPLDAWKVFSERIGIKEPYYQALASITEKWASEGRRGEFLDDLLAFLYSAWRTGALSENSECAKLIEKRCKERGGMCLADCTHAADEKAIRDRVRGQI